MVHKVKVLKHANSSKNKPGNKSGPMKSQFEDLSHCSEPTNDESLRNCGDCCTWPNLQEPQDYIPQHHNTLPSTSISITVFIIIHFKGKKKIISYMFLLLFK